MKHIITGLLLLLSVGSTQARSLVLTLTDGTLVYYLLGGDTDPVMVLGDEGITVNADAYQLSGLRCFYISETDDPNPSAVSDASAARPVYQQGTLRIPATQDTQVAVYTTGGTQVQAPVTRTQGQVTVQLHALPRGIYIVRVGSASLKVNKQ